MRPSLVKDKRNSRDGNRNQSRDYNKANNVVKLSNQSKQEYFDSLNPFLDAKPFWKSCKQFFSDKHSFGDSKIALNENGENMKMAKNFNSYFESVTDSFELFDWPLQSNISYMAKCKILLKVFPIILVLLKSSTNSS